MSFPIARFAFYALCVVPMLAYGQTQPLPSQIKGRWTYQAHLTNIFSLSEIKEAPDRTFTAKLEWWTANSRCAVRDERISGKITDRGIAWDFATASPCNDPYVVELSRGDKGWEGKATGKVNNVVADLKAE